MIFRLQTNGGIRRLFLFKYLFQYSTTAAAAPPKPSQVEPHFLVNYLIGSLGLSRNEAQIATDKLTPHKSSRNDPESVVNFFKELGLNKTQIRSIVSSQPRILTCNVEKTLKPKTLALQDLGISGPSLIQVLMSYKSILIRGLISPSIEYLRNLLGSDEHVIEAVMRYSRVLDCSALKVIGSNAELLQKHGLPRECVSRFVRQNPWALVQKPERLVEVLSMVEYKFGIPRDTKMFFHGVIVVSSLSKKTIDMKIGVFRSFGWSDEAIYGMIKLYPEVLNTSVEKMSKVWNFFTNDVGYAPDFLVSHPVIFNLSLEKRVIPRYEVLKFLNEKKLNKRKTGLYTVLCISESKFVNVFILPHKNEIPDDVFNSYFKIVGSKETGKLRSGYVVRYFS